MNLDTEISELDLIFNPNIDIILGSKTEENKNNDSCVININDEDSGDEDSGDEDI